MFSLKWNRQISFSAIGVTTFIVALALFARQLPLRAQDDPVLTLVVQLVPGTDPIQVSNDHQLTIIDTIDALSLYRLQTAAPDAYIQLAVDPRVVAVMTDDVVMSFQAEQRDLTDGDFEGLNHYLGFGNGDGTKKPKAFGLNEKALVVRKNYTFAESWLTWWQVDTHLDRAHRYGTGTGITVAVLDTGADLDHPALVNHLVAGYDFVDHDLWPDDAPNGMDDDEDGRVDEGAGHGTHVSGILAKAAPGIQIMPIRVLNSDGSGTLFDIVNGFIYAVDHGAQIINLSLSSHDHFALLETAIAYAQSHDVIVIAAAAGTEVALEYPAAYADVIAVGATRRDGYVTDFTLPYANLVDVFAPGELIYGPYYDGGYAWWSGSSMAAPIIAGEAALLIEHGACVPTCVTTLLTEKVQPVVPALTKGRADAYQAIIYAPNADPEQGVCLLLIDQSTLHPNIDAIEQAAEQHDVSAGWLLNTDLPTTTGNPWLRWNEFFSGDVVLLPGGHLADAGWFALPATASWSLQDFFEGHVSEEQLANVLDVIPLYSQELAHLLGRTCVAIVYKDNIVVDATVHRTNLRAARYGRFAFTVLGLEVPGDKTNSDADGALYDLWVRVESPRDFTTRFAVSSPYSIPDDLEFTKISYHKNTLTVQAVNNEASGALLTLSVASDGESTSAGVPFLLEAPMVYDGKKKHYEFTFATDEALDKRRLTISSSLGGVANHTAGKKIVKGGKHDSAKLLAPRLFLPLVMR